MYLQEWQDSSNLEELPLPEQIRMMVENRQVIKVTHSNYPWILKYFPRFDLRHIRVIILDYNQIFSLNKIEDHAQWHSLQELSLENNEIRAIHELTRIQMPHLIKLSLSNNLIECLSPLAGIDAQKLKVLNLGHNNIGDIQALSKCNFPILRQLYLNQNHLTQLKPFSKMWLDNVHNLSISGNQISTLTPLLRNGFLIQDLILSNISLIFNAQTEYYIEFLSKNNALFVEQYAADQEAEHFNYLQHQAMQPEY